MIAKTVVSRRSVIIASYVLAGLALISVLWLHLLPALLAGLLVYELVVTLTPLLQRWLRRDRARWLVVSGLTIILVGLLILVVLGLISFAHDELGNPQDFWREQVMPLVDKARLQMPAWIVDHLPDSVDDLRNSSLDWLRAHAATLQLAGKEAARVVVHILIGLVLGAIVAIGRGGRMRERGHGALTLALSLRCKRLADAFHNIVFAQVKISLLNTVFTAIFLFVLLPLLGVHLPLTKTLVVLTFVAGLLPVIGNLISNTAIVVVALSVSLGAGVGALVFLIAIHKLEYFLNARIVGTQIRARAWELLIAMLVMEAAFGLAGVIAAPIFYAYLKRELKAAKLI